MDNKKPLTILCACAIGLLLISACGVDSASTLPAPADLSTDAAAPIGPETDTPMADVAAPIIPEAQTPQEFYLRTASGVLRLGDTMETAVSLLGNPHGVFEMPSCAFDGMDRVYGFDKFQLYTYSDGAAEIVYVISLLEGASSTNGVAIGSSVQDMRSAYGTDYTESFGMFTYERGSTVLQFFIDDGAVASIVYMMVFLD